MSHIHAAVIELDHDELLYNPGFKHKKSRISCLIRADFSNV